MDKKGKRNTRKLGLFVGLVGYLLLIPEWAFGYYELALYQLLTFSIYLQFIILHELVAWSVRRHLEGAEFRLVVARLAYAVFFLLFWFLNNSLIGLVAKIPQFTIWLYSSAIIVILTLGASITDYVMNRGKSKKQDTVRTVKKSRQSQKIFHTVSIRTLVFASPFMILGGILLIYVGLLYQEFRALYFGGFLIFLAIVAPIIRIREDNLRRARRKEAELRRKSNLEK